MKSFQAHTTELESLLNQSATLESVLGSRGAPLVRSDKDHPLSLEAIPDSSRLPPNQQGEVRQRLVALDTALVYRHNDALELLFFDSRGKMVAFNRCLP